MRTSIACGLLALSFGCSSQGTPEPSYLELGPALDTSLTGTFTYQGETFGLESRVESGVVDVSIVTATGQSVIAWRATADAQSSVTPGSAFEETPGSAFEQAMLTDLSAHLMEWAHIESTEAQHLSWQALVAVTQFGAAGATGDATEVGALMAQNCGTGDSCWFGVSGDYCLVHDYCCAEHGWWACLTICWGASLL